MRLLSVTGEAAFLTLIYMGILGVTVRNVTYMLFTGVLTGGKLHLTFFPDTSAVWLVNFTVDDC